MPVEELEEESYEPESEASGYEEISFEEFKSGVYVTLSDTMFQCSSNAYWMIYGKEAGDSLYEDFYFPDEETYALLATDDFSTRLLVDLSKYLAGHRDKVWED